VFFSFQFDKNISYQIKILKIFFFFFFFFFFFMLQIMSFVAFAFCKKKLRKNRDKGLK
jgi:hypothetical protein